jgi:hypothetical protein|tara:strand:- start:791 stop:937 length:147 start_codon:yes stop_codon:yes gene_type:complete
MLSIEAYQTQEVMNIDQYGYHLYEFIEDKIDDVEDAVQDIRENIEKYV